MHKLSKSAWLLVVTLVCGLTVGFSSPSAARQATEGAAITAERFVETSDGSVWTIFTFDTEIDDNQGTEAAIEGGLTSDGIRLEVSGWPRVLLGERYEVTVNGSANSELAVPALIAAIPVRSNGGGDQSPGYTPGPASWEDGSDLRWQGNPSTFPSGADLSNQGITTAVNNGISGWTTDAGSVTISSSYGGTTSIATNEFDGVNAVYWANTTSEERYLARTYLWFTDPDSDPSTPGKALEFDIKFNNDYLWALSATSGRFDIESVSLHEAGHAVGLGHVDLRENSMFPSLVVGATKRDLGRGDKAGMQALYGDGSVVVNQTSSLCKGKKATIVGSELADVLTGTSGDDVIFGGGGDDTITGGGGNDIICGGAGNDTIDAGAGNDKVYAGKGNDEVRGGPGKDTLIGEAGSDTLRGGPKRDVLKGGGGNDKLYGDAGRDKLVGQGGSDLLVGGKNPDKLIGGGGKDTLSTTSGDTGSAGKGRDRCTSAGTISSCEKRI